MLIRGNRACYPRLRSQYSNRANSRMVVKEGVLLGRDSCIEKKVWSIFRSLLRLSSSLKCVPLHIWLTIRDCTTYATQVCCPYVYVIRDGTSLGTINIFYCNCTIALVIITVVVSAYLFILLEFVQHDLIYNMI